MAFKDFFHFSKSERIGALVLILSVCALIGYRYYVGQKTQDPLSVEVRQIVLDSAEVLKKKKADYKPYIESSTREWSLTSPVDLNYLSAKEMYGSGFSKSLVDAIFSYKRSNGMLKNTKALNSFQNVSKSELDSLKKYADFSRYAKKPSKEIPERQGNKNATRLPPMDLNAISALELKKISGIGEVLSERIIKFRDALGGFYTVDQLKEVYGLEDSIIDANESLFLIETPHRKIAVNRASEEELSAHAYITLKMAKTLVKFREQNSKLTEEKFARIYSLTSNQKERIKPYLDFEN